MFSGVNTSFSAYARVIHRIKCGECMLYSPHVTNLQLFYGYWAYVVDFRCHFSVILLHYQFYTQSHMVILGTAGERIIYDRTQKLDTR